MTNVRANWELALARLAQSLVVSFVFLLGLVPPLVLAGVGVVGLLADAGAGRAAGGDVWSGLAGRSAGIVLLAAGATLLLWLLAVLLHCFAQGGILGVLAAGDRQAPPGAARGEWFRTFSLRDLVGWGRRLLGRMLGLWLIAMGLCAVLTLGAGLCLGLAALGGERWGPGAAAGIACGGALPVLFVWLVLVLWWQVGQALLAEEHAAFWASLAEALRIVGRRLGGLLLIAALLLAALLALNVIFLPLSMGVEVALSQRASARLVAGSLLALAQWLAASLLAVLYAGGLVALARSERRRNAGAER